ncbi:MAG: hypothetical protein LBH43_06300 [Treponema sp.]|jgi:heptaprenyl diphosphate synthase|nr:hypothetical protein [Treponema sp.]
MKRLARQEAYNNLFSACSLCIAGFLIIPFFLFNPSPMFRSAQFIFFWFLSWLSGRKNNPLVTLSAILFVVFFNLLVPYGQVLFSLGFFRITRGALTLGIHRAATLAGLVMLSRVCIRQDLRLPGFFGGLIAESFRIFARMRDSKQRITMKNFASDIDVLMLEMSAEENLYIEEEKNKTKTTGLFILAAVIILNCSLCFLGYWYN